VRRFPWLTLVVAVLTVAGLVFQELVPGTLADLQRDPAAWHGEPWRWLTALVVQDGGWLGGALNVGFLLAAGIALEQVVRRTAWLVAYVGTGLVGQLVGHWWQPVGGGNSVAVCGLVGLLVVLVAHGQEGPGPLPRLTPPIWCGALAGAVAWPFIALGAVVGVVATGPGRPQPWSAYLLVGWCAACALVLLVARDVHGGALTFALLVSAVPQVTSVAQLPAARIRVAEG
jgi:membrane associated rhomboid family serine protease